MKPLDLSDVVTILCTCTCGYSKAFTAERIDDATSTAITHRTAHSVEGRLRFRTSLWRGQFRYPVLLRSELP